MKLKQEKRYENLSSSAHVVHTTVNQDESGCEMFKNEKCTYKACKTTVFPLLNMQISDVFVAVVVVVA